MKGKHHAKIVPTFLGARAVLCHTLAQWKDRPRASNSGRAQTDLHCLSPVRDSSMQRYQHGTATESDKANRKSESKWNRPGFQSTRIGVDPAQAAAQRRKAATKQ
eukprot:9471225-Pyramimonas_sp.AAC.1